MATGAGAGYTIGNLAGSGPGPKPAGPGPGTRDPTRIIGLVERLRTKTHRPNRSCLSQVPASVSLP